MKKGFTLVELLVVLVVIGILIAIILPNALKAIDQANTKHCASNVRSIDTAVQLYYSENRAWPPAAADLLPYFPDEDGDGTNDAPTCPYGVTYALADTDGVTGNDRCDRTSHFSAGNWPNVHD